MPYTPIDPASAAVVASTLGAPLTSTGETLESLRTQLAFELGNRTDILPEQYGVWINWAYRHVAALVNTHDLIGSLEFDTTVDQAQYLLPATISWIRNASVVDTSTYQQGGRRLEKIDDQLYRNLEDLSDEPTHFFRLGRVLVLWPTPSTARTVALDARYRPADLVADTDSPILPVEFHEPILLFAKQRAFRATRQFGAAFQAQNEAVSTIRPLINTDAEERGNAHGRVQPIRTAAEMYRRRR